MALPCAYFLSIDFTCQGLRHRWQCWLRNMNFLVSLEKKGLGPASISLGQFATSSGKEGFYVNVLKQNLRLMT